MPRRARRGASHLGSKPVDNALKYSSEARDKEIVLSCRREGDGVVLSVADHGPGVARAHLRKI
ncbi:MAG: sensor histidine kinase, partial [bacterium]|nr:sensor histidine kinase [bacterium]